jgi:hypothetical protein
MPPLCSTEKLCHELENKGKTATPNWLFKQTQKLQDGTKPRKAKTHKEEAGITRPDITKGTRDITKGTRDITKGIQKDAAEIGGASPMKVMENQGN